MNAGLFCTDLNDVPELTGPIMPKRGRLLVELNFDQIAQCYEAANWRWLRGWRDELPKTPNATSHDDMGILPSAQRIKHEIEMAICEVGEKPGDYIQFGGIVVFRSKSGLRGVILDGLLGDHLTRVKEMGPAECLKAIELCKQS